MMKKLYFFLLAATLCVACNNKSDRSAADGQISDFYDQRAAQSAAQQGAEATASTSSAGTGNTAIKMYEVPARLTDRPEVILHRQGFTISYNKTTKTPNWVAWHLTKGHTYGRIQREMQAFQEDSSVPAPRATLDDYYNSRYDRGHMCPAGDNKWDATAMSESFLFTNICPQNHALNKYEWNTLEIKCRDWARKYGAVDIVCGPVYDRPTPTRTIGRGRVWVPDGFFKVVLCRVDKPKAIGFLFRNDGKKVSIESCVRSVDDIERLTGIDFFPALDDKVENRIEATANYREWQ